MKHVDDFHNGIIEEMDTYLADHSEEKFLLFRDYNIDVLKEKYELIYHLAEGVKQLQKKLINYQREQIHSILENQDSLEGESRVRPEFAYTTEKHKVNEDTNKQINDENDISLDLYAPCKYKLHGLLTNEMFEHIYRVIRNRAIKIQTIQYDLYGYQKRGVCLGAFEKIKTSVAELTYKIEDSSLEEKLEIKTTQPTKTLH